MSKGNELNYINVARWIATCAVVFIHVFTGVYHVIPDDLSIFQLNEYMIGHTLFMFCVPFFVMITGVLFLNKDKKITVKQLLFKYEKRVILALLIFGYFYCLIELFFEEKQFSFGMFSDGFVNLLEGKTWAHLWYLYMLVGLYLIIPIIKVVIDNAADKLLRYFVLVMFIFNCCFPYIERVANFNFGVQIPISSCYILYLILGYMLNEGKINFSISASVIGISGSLLLFIICILVGIKNTLEYNNPLVVIYSVCLFNVVKKINWHGQFYMLVKKTNYLSFGIYLVHNLFVNVIYKFLHKYPHNIIIAFVPACIIYFIGILLISVIASFILNKIPFLRKYVL